MEKLIELNTDPNILVSSSIIQAQKPDYIYIPILRNSSILIHQNDLVEIGHPIIKKENQIYTSSVSGRVTAIKKINTINGQYDAIEIMNDFKEKHVVESGTKRSLVNIKKEKIENALNTYKLNLKGKKNLVLNGIDDEPYVLTSNFYLFNEQVDLLELLDKLSKTYEIEKTIITVKSTSSNNIHQLMNKLGMYPNITLMILPNLYLLGKSEFLLKYLGLEKEKTEVIETEKLYYLNNLIKKNRPISTKYITVSGNNIDNPSVMKVKIGSKLKEILKENIKIKENSIYIANGLMKGKSININEFIITEDLNSVLIMKQKKEPKEAKCLNCGACIDICPMNLNPILLQNKNYRKKIQSNCIKCGLCSYICPSYINFNIEENE